jgi:hypothetical protein
MLFKTTRALMAGTAFALALIAVAVLGSGPGKAQGGLPSWSGHDYWLPGWMHRHMWGTRWPQCRDESPPETSLDVHARRFAQRI